MVLIKPLFRQLLIAWNTVFASKLAPTGSSATYPVGASLLAKGPVQPQHLCGFTSAFASKLAPTGFVAYSNPWEILWFRPSHYSGSY
ncbi:Uncharacterised protein [Paucimonas lemoignei]|nr:Uncharacterised protein [Paucimonas lemoignei]